MNILFFVNTPAQVHESKYVVRTLEARGHLIMILARDYECTLPLLDAYGLRYEVYGRAQKRGYGRPLELIPYGRGAYRLARKFKPQPLGLRPDQLCSATLQGAPRGLPQCRRVQDPPLHGRAGCEIVGEPLVGSWKLGGYETRPYAFSVR